MTNWGSVSFVYSWESDRPNGERFQPPERDQFNKGISPRSGWFRNVWLKRGKRLRNGNQGLSIRRRGCVDCTLSHRLRCFAVERRACVWREIWFRAEGSKGLLDSGGCRQSERSKKRFAMGRQRFDWPMCRIGFLPTLSGGSVGSANAGTRGVRLSAIVHRIHHHIGR